MLRLRREFSFSPVSDLPIGILAHAVVCTLGISVPAVWHAWRGTLTPAICDEKLHKWSRQLVDRAGINVVVHGQDVLLTHQPPFIVISNHQSLYDIPVLFQALPLSLRMAAKKELFSFPIWGRAMTAAGFVKIDRKDRERAHEALRAAGLAMSEQKLSLMIAPEGTRSVTGQLLPFKNGAFHLAKATGLPILPVFIDGTILAHKSGDFTVHRGQTVHVHILPPLLPAQFESADAMRAEALRILQQAQFQSRNPEPKVEAEHPTSLS